MKPFFPVLLCAFLCCCGAVANAQFRIYGGVQLSKADYSIQNAKQPTDFKQDFMAGIGLTTLVEGPLYFAPSLYYSQKGYKVTFNRPAYPPDINAKNNNTTLNTICFAPLLQFNLSKSSNHLFFRFAPAADFALSGSETFDSTGGKQVSRSMLFGSTGYSPLTLFGVVQLGFEQRKGFTLFAHYEHGLSSLNNADLGPIILHRIVGVSAGWNF